MALCAARVVRSVQRCGGGGGACRTLPGGGGACRTLPGGGGVISAAAALRRWMTSDAPPAPITVVPRRATDDAETMGRPGSKRARAAAAAATGGSGGGFLRSMFGARASPAGGGSDAATTTTSSAGGGASGGASGGGSGAGGGSWSGYGAGNRNGFGSTRVPGVVAALGAASLLPIAFYAAQHAPASTTTPPVGDKVIAAAQAYLPFSIGWALSHNQETVRRRYVAYLAAVTSFVGAVHWGLAAAAPSPVFRAAPYLVGVVPALVAWVASSLPVDSLVPHAAMSITLFGLWVYEERLVATARAPAWYPALRTPLTFSVLVATVLCNAMASEKGVAPPLPPRRTA